MNRGLSMKTRLVLLLAALGAHTPASAASGDDEATAVEQATAQTLAERIQGEWNIVLSEQEKKQLDAMKLAFKEPPPTEAELEAANLSEEEGFLVALILMARSEDPNDPKIAEMKAAMDGLANAGLTITADTMTITVAGDAQATSYRVVEESDVGLEMRSTVTP
jgi:hypothetical protein